MTSSVGPDGPRGVGYVGGGRDVHGGAPNSAGPVRPQNQVEHQGAREDLNITAARSRAPLSCSSILPTASRTWAEMPPAYSEPRASTGIDRCALASVRVHCAPDGPPSSA